MVRYHVVATPPDGDCLFSAVLQAWCDYTGLSPPSREAVAEAVRAMRELCVMHLLVSQQGDAPIVRALHGMGSGLDYGKPIVINQSRRIARRRSALIVQSGLERGESVEDYARRMRRRGAWGGEPELISLSDLLGVRVVVYWKGAKEGHRQRNEYGTTGPKLRVMYAESHYSALRQSGQEGVGVHEKEKVPG